jgi:medium-chain acyl-[acyl-carrier-protein] hydrolase
MWGSSKAPVPSSTPWLTPFRPNPEATLRLICFPYAGGSSFIFRNWAEHLPKAVEVCPVQLPGRGGRLKETAFLSFPPLIEALTRSVLPWLDKPFVFFGHSLGAVIAFELAQKLSREQRLEPLHLFVAGRHAPHLPDTHPATHDLPDDEFKEELRRLNGTSAEVLAHPELLEFILPLLRADFELCHNYEYAARPPLKCAITAYGGMCDADVSREQLSAWREHTSAAFSLRMLPGDHFFIHSAELMLMQMLTMELQSILQRLKYGHARTAASGLTVSEVPRAAE